jgi:hypothetical protein
MVASIPPQWISDADFPSGVTKLFTVGAPMAHEPSMNNPTKASFRINSSQREVVI